MNAARPGVIAGRLRRSTMRSGAGAPAGSKTITFQRKVLQRVLDPWSHVGPPQSA